MAPTESVDQDLPGPNTLPALSPEVDTEMSASGAPTATSGGAGAGVGLSAAERARRQLRGGQSPGGAAGPITLFQQAQNLDGDARSPATRSTDQRVVLDSAVPRARGMDRLVFHDEELGRGGLGIVRAAEDKLLRRELAVKELHWSFDERAVEAFIEEAQVTGQLEHPNIVPVHELGFGPDGMPYLVMKRVVGRNLETIIDETDERIREAQRNDPAEALRVGARDERLLLDIFEKMCDAIAYAHFRGVIHRDIKPANVMIGEFGEVLVVDWGLAKPLGRVGGDARTSGAVRASQRPGGTLNQTETGTVGPDSSDKLVWSDRRQEHADQTIQGTVMGTPAYMPPEQARGRTADMDERTDIYSLGAVLYDMLTGQPPFAGDAEVVLDQVRTGRITPPSQKARGRHVPRELEAVVLKAMSYRRTDRYGSVAELKADIDAYRDGRALSAIDYSPWELIRKFAMRHRGPVFTGLGAAALLIAVIVWSIVSLDAERTKALDEARRADQEAANARDAGHEAREQAALAAEQARLAEESAKRAATEAKAADRARAEAERERRDTARAFDAALAFRADHALKNNDVLSAMALLRETTSTRATIARFAIRPPPMTWHARLDGHEDGVHCVAISPDGLLIASGADDRTVHLWRASDGESVATLKGHEGPVVDLAFSPDSRMLASVSLDGDIRLWDTRSYGPVGQIMLPGLMGLMRFGSSVTFTPDGRRLLAGGFGATIWDPATQQQIGTIAEPFGGDMQRRMQELMANPQAMRDMMRQMQDLFDGRRRPGGADSTPMLFSSTLSVDVSPDGSRYMTGDSDGTVRIWDATSYKEIAKLEGHFHMVVCSAWEPDGRLLATGSFDRTVRIWDTVRNEEMDRLQGHDDWVSGLRWLPSVGGRKRLMSVSRDRTARVWDVDEAREVFRLPTAQGPLTRVDKVPGSTIVAISSADHSVRLYDLAPQAANPDVVGRHQSLVLDLEFSPDGRILATGSHDRTVQLWDVVNRRSMGAGPRHRRSVNSVAFSRDGRLLATASISGTTVQLWDVDQGGPVGSGLSYSQNVGDIAFTPDGKYLIVGLADGKVHLHNLLEGRNETHLIGHTAAITSVAVSRDGHWLITGSEDRSARIWDLQTQLEVGRLLGHAEAILSVAISPDGMNVATGAMDGTVRIWDLRRRLQLQQLDGHERAVLSVGFSPDGRLLATSTINDMASDGVTRVWDVRDGRELTRIPTQGGSCFSPDGKLLAVGTANGGVRICGAAVPSDRDVVARVTGLERDGFDLRSISKSRERKLRQQFPALPDVWNTPDPITAAFWNACWDTISGLAGDDDSGPLEPEDPAFGRALRPLQSWRERHPRHPMAEIASDIIGAARDRRDPRAVFRN